MEKELLYISKVLSALQAQAEHNESFDKEFLESKSAKLVLGGKSHTVRRDFWSVPPILLSYIAQRLTNTSTSQPSPKS